MNTPDNTQIPFTPVNELEQTLLDAVNNPAARPEFYRLLLESDLVMLATVDPEAIKDGNLQPDTPLQVLTWMKGEEPVVPLFSAVERLQEAIKDSGAEFPYVIMNGHMLFSALTQGTLNAVLNPRCALGKEFLLEEMRDLVSGDLFQRMHQEMNQAPREIMLGQPAVYPRELVDTLRGLFARHDSIDAAYLAQAHDPASGEEPHPLIGLQITGDISAAISDAGIAMEGLLPEGVNAEFVVMDGGDLDSYFLSETTPFYKKGESYTPAPPPAATSSATPSQSASQQTSQASASQSASQTGASTKPAGTRPSSDGGASGTGSKDEKKPWWKVW